jgi:hypothetical protein
LKLLRELAELPVRIENNKRMAEKNFDTQNFWNFMTLQVKWPNATDYSIQSSFCGHITEEHKKLTAIIG